MIILTILKRPCKHLRIMSCMQDFQSEFWLESVSFLGHAISSEGIKVDPQKIEAAKNCPRLTTPTKIRSFLGLDDYYRRFVEGFSFLTSPLTKLTQKAAKFQ